MIREAVARGSVFIRRLPTATRDRRRTMIRNLRFNWRLCSIGAGLVFLLAGPGLVQANPRIYELALKSTGWIIVPSEKNSALGTCWVADHEKKLVVTSF